MTFQSKKILFDLIRTQETEGDLICVEYEDGYFGRLHNADEEPRRVTFRYPSENIVSILSDLEKEGMIAFDMYDRSMVIVTHAGNHTRQIFLRKLMYFLFSSIAVPIIVTILTNIALYAMKRFLPWMG